MAYRLRNRHLRKRYGATSNGTLAEALIERRPAEALWRVVCGSAMARRLRKHYDGTPGGALRVRRTAEARWRVDCGSAMAQSSAEALCREACISAMARRLRKRSGLTREEALGTDYGGSALARGLRKCQGKTPAEALWRDAWGSAMARRLRRRHSA